MVITSGETRDSVEFVAFLLWYLFLIFCCVLPTCCAYRRRRMMARLQREEDEWENRFQLLGNLAGQHCVNDEEVRLERTKRITEALKATNFVVQDKDISARNYEGKTEDKVSTTEVDEELGAVIDHEVMDQSALTLPSEQPNGGRTVPGGCAICLDLYKDGDAVAWSKEATCKHAFHSECIIPWLAKNDDPKCPCCRQEFCLVEPVAIPETTNTLGRFGLIPSSLIIRHALSQHGSDAVIVPTSQDVTEDGIAPMPDRQTAEAAADVNETLANENNSNARTPNEGSDMVRSASDASECEEEDEEVEMEHDRVKSESST